MRKQIMVKYILILTLFYLSISCNGQPVQMPNVEKNDFTKIAILSLPFPEDIRDSVAYVYNLDMSVYTCFEFDSISSETKCGSLKGKIMAYYPSWDMMAFFYEHYNDRYCKIRVGNSWKILRNELIYNVCELDSFLCSAEFWPKQNDLFFQDDLETKISPPNVSLLKCKIIKVMGDWIQVQDDKFKAWIKWKDGSYVFPDRIRFDI